MHARVKLADPELNGSPPGGVDTGSSVAAVGSILKIGSKARLVALSDGIAIEVLNSSGVWVRETAFEES